VLDIDIRGQTSSMVFAATAPVVLVYATRATGAGQSTHHCRTVVLTEELFNMRRTDEGVSMPSTEYPLTD
jgi:hypothetical protein